MYIFYIRQAPRCARSRTGTPPRSLGGEIPMMLYIYIYTYRYCTTIYMCIHIYIYIYIHKYYIERGWGREPGLPVSVNKLSSFIAAFALQSWRTSFLTATGTTFNSAPIPGGESLDFSSLQRSIRHILISERRSLR